MKLTDQTSQTWHTQRRGQAFFKWLAILAILAAGALGYLFVSGKQAHEAQIAQLRAENQQELAKQSEELERLRNENKEIEKLRADTADLPKLRADSAQLRAMQKEQQRIAAENQQLQGTIQQLKEVGSENSTLRNQVNQLQGAAADRNNIAVCINNLKTIEGVKARWAADFQKRPTDLPLDTDLFGPGKYLPQKPACPAGGVYTVGTLQAKPTCSVPGHSY